MNAERLVALARDLNAAHAPKGHSCGGYGDSVQVRKTLPDNTTNDGKVVGEDTMNLKPSSGNGDRYVPALQVSSAGGNSSPGDASHREDRGSPSSSYTTNSIVSTRNRVPYFRYFGPTAIGPGFTQMVVQIRDHLEPSLGRFMDCCLSCLCASPISS